MNLAFEVLMVVALLGGVDVLWFHLYRLRLYERPASRAEQFTHLSRHLLFAALSGLMVTGAPRWVLMALLAIDLVNSLVDLVLEPRSRAELGGVSGLESAIHGAAVFGLGMVTALVWTSSTTWEPSSLQLLRGLATSGLAIVLFTVELSLTLRRAPHTLASPS